VWENTRNYPLINVACKQLKKVKNVKEGCLKEKLKNAYYPPDPEDKFCVLNSSDPPDTKEKCVKCI
jgi:hypothetical protein